MPPKVQIAVWRHAVEGIRQLGIGALTGVLTGILVGGLGGRLVMRVSGFLTASELIGQRTENGNVVGQITLPGTLSLLLFVGIFAGIFGGWLYAALRPSLGWARRWRGIVFGGVLLALLGSPIIDPDNFDFRRFGVPSLNVTMFAALFISFGAVIEPLYEKVDAAFRARRPHLATEGVRRAVWLAAIAPLALVVAIFGANVIRVVLGIQSMQLTAESALFVASLVLLATLVGIRVYRPLAWLSYVILALVVTVAGARTLYGIVQVIRG